MMHENTDEGTSKKWRYLPGEFRWLWLLLATVGTGLVNVALVLQFQRQPVFASVHVTQTVLLQKELATLRGIETALNHTRVSLRGMEVTLDSIHKAMPADRARAGQRE